MKNTRTIYFNCSNTGFSWFHMKAASVMMIRMCLYPFRKAVILVLILNCNSTLLFNIRILWTGKLGDLLNKPVLSEFWIITAATAANVSNWKFILCPHPPSPFFLKILSVPLHPWQTPQLLEYAQDEYFSAYIVRFYHRFCNKIFKHGLFQSRQFCIANKKMHGIDFFATMHLKLLLL